MIDRIAEWVWGGIFVALAVAGFTLIIAIAMVTVIVLTIAVGVTAIWIAEFIGLLQEGSTS